MSFHEVPRQGRSGALGAAVSAALYRSERGTSLRLMLGRDLLRHLGWQEDDRLKLLFGQDEDFGRARLLRTSDGGSKLLAPDRNRRGRGCLVFSTQRLPRELDRRPRSAVTIPHQVIDDGLEFQLSRWLGDGRKPSAP